MISQMDIPALVDSVSQRGPWYRALSVLRRTGGFIAAFFALIAGILILLIPRLLNFVVAIYLILIGLIGLARQI